MYGNHKKGRIRLRKELTGYQEAELVGIVGPSHCPQLLASFALLGPHGLDFGINLLLRQPKLCCRILRLLNQRIKLLERWLSHGLQENVLVVCNNKELRAFPKLEFLADRDGAKIDSLPTSIRRLGVFGQIDYICTS